MIQAHSCSATTVGDDAAATRYVQWNSQYYSHVVCCGEAEPLQRQGVPIDAMLCAVYATHMHMAMYSMILPFVWSMPLP